MATLLSDASADGAGSGASHTAPATVHLHADSVLDGARIEIEAATTDTAAEYANTGVYFDHRNRKPQNCDIQGTYYLRAVVRDANNSTSLTVETT